MGAVVGGLYASGLSAAKLVGAAKARILISDEGGLLDDAVLQQFPVPARPEIGFQRGTGF